MFTTLFMAGVLPLTAINAQDPRLLEENTFVSQKAQKVLAGEREGEVLCLKRTGENDICLARTEWSKAATLANAAPRLRNMSRIQNQQSGI